MENNARVNCRAGDSLDRNNWSGPVSLAGGTVILQGGGGTSYRFYGQISGSGGINKTGDVWVYLTHTNNTYSGNTTVNQGLLHANNAGAIPDYAKVTVNNGNDTLAVLVGDGTNGWSNAEIKSLHDAATFADADSYLAFDLANGDLDYPNNFPVPMGISVMNGGELTIPDGQSLRSAIRIYTGSLVLNDVYVYTTNKYSYVGANSGTRGLLRLSGDTALVGIEYAYNTGNHEAVIVGENGTGVLIVEDNATITNKLLVGNNGGSAGAVYQQGGTVINWGGAGNDGRIGMTGYGYYELNDGFYKQKGYSQLGRNAAGVGILRQLGGTFNQSTEYGGNLGICRGGTGVYNQRGGLFTTPGILEIGDDSDNSTTGGYAEYTIEGGQALITADILMANRNNMTAVMNLNGGEVDANRIYRNAARTGSKAYVNFDGGLYRERNGGNVIDSGTSAPDAVNVYDGGAKIDTQSYNCVMPVSMLAPAGNGVASISVLTQGAGYIGPPMVRITGGDGFGATAVADIDYASGTLTGVTVTSPGFGYTTAPTVTLTGGGATTAATVSLALGANVSGGLTKLGSGSLVMTATNTYTGITVISNGVFKLGRADALPVGNDISVDGGIYDLGGYTITNGAVTVTAGSIINGTLVSDSLTKTGAGELLLNTGVDTADPIVINGGAVRLTGMQPGLYEGSIAQSGINTVTPNPATDTELTTVMANTTSGWPANTTYIYTGFIWNRESTNVTWTFAENFDDAVYLVIDTTTVLNNGSWNTPTRANYTLTPGAHFFEARFYQGGGGAGPVSSSWWTTTAFSFGVDFQGRDAGVIGNYVPLVDPGDGSLLTTTLGSETDLLAADSTVLMAAGTVFDLGGITQNLDTLSGSGTVSNGTLVVNNTLAPGGIDTIGTLSIDASLSVNATVLIDVATDGSSDLLEVAGDLDLSSATLTIANPEDLDTAEQYTIIDCGGTITAPFASVNTGDGRWKVVYKPDGTAKLVYISGTLIIIR